MRFRIQIVVSYLSKQSFLSLIGYHHRYSTHDRDRGGKTPKEGMFALSNGNRKPAAEPKYRLFKLPSLLPIVYTTHYEQSSPDTRHQTRLQLRVRRIHNFFIFSEANLSEYGSYSLHICLFRYILKHHLFPSFPSNSHQNTRTDSHTNIRFDAKNSMLQQRVAANIEILSYW